ncbi:MAG TPA: arylamine N-acetyltransferase [Magnetospirillaceae bacterium]|jgi:N-hydroxyarylamine O-acetyltransferase
MTSGFRLDRYLARIGITRPVAPDLATLTDLHAAHVRAIPFEGLDPFLRRPVPLDLDALQAKLVDSRRGGYCVEQNLLLKSALEAIGFQVTGLGGRVRWNARPKSPPGPRTHMLLKVDLPEGPHLADVGLGACVQDAPLRLETEVEQRTAMSLYRLNEADGLYTLSINRPKGWRTAYVFDLQPQLASDYEVSNWYTATHPTSHFVTTLIVERLREDKRYKLIGRHFIVEARDGVIVEERTLESAEALGGVLDEVFGIVPPVPIEDLFARLNSAT